VPEDVPALCDVNIRSIREVCARDYSEESLEDWCANKVPETYLGWLANPKLRLYTGLYAGKVAGVGLFDTNGWIFLLYVAPEALGTGLGKALLVAMEAQARELGLPTLRLRSTLTARAFYESQGYVNLGFVDGERPAYEMEKVISAGRGTPLAPS
jgi:GNAT superfamily N-acetyltransferase